MHPETGSRRSGLCSRRSSWNVLPAPGWLRAGSSTTGPSRMAASTRRPPASTTPSSSPTAVTPPASPWRSTPVGLLAAAEEHGSPAHGHEAQQLPLIGRSSLDQAEDTPGLCSSPRRATSTSKLAVRSRRIGCSPHCAAPLRAWHPLAGLPFSRGFWPERFTGRPVAWRPWSEDEVWRPAQCGGATLPQLVSAVWLAVRKPPGLAARSRLRTRA